MIDILLSTYNGEKYIYELLESLKEQTYKDFRILIRDDSSSDNTVGIIEKFKESNNINIEIINDNKGNIGSTASFESLVNYSTADYFMFCDQDDVWLPNKIALSINKIEELEKKFGKNIPLLIFTNLKIVDSKLNLISESYFKYQNISPSVCYNIWKCMALSVAAGCTMILNKYSKEYILPIPKYLIHDHWIISNIVYWGKCDYILEPTILYRQHNNNSVGASSTSTKYLLNRLTTPIKWLTLYKKELGSFKFRVNYVAFIYYKLLFYFLRLFKFKLI
ncbi:glycosyltransferase family 2 protein [uncultured Bacteroides sp.]|uniref:glycosyltransferase family 2 protein n=1 Tax=uncultured Bacteroides sp. TaxID=162156 RepID=UPI0025973176|nr:glycosyltransferase family 2 protein [uncultured Bacteroides sp.]